MLHNIDDELKNKAENAFLNQTVQEDDKGTIHYVKPDVQQAQLMYADFLQEPKNEKKYTMLCNAVQVCAENRRKGFKELLACLETLEVKNKTPEKFKPT